MSNETIKYLSEAINSKGLEPDINLSRPTYLQPEDRILYRAMRILIILGMLNTKGGLSKKLIACVDFILRNTGLQYFFISEYFKGQKNIIDKLNTFSGDNQLEFDFNVIEYKSAPWDIRFNDIFMYLHIRNMIESSGNHKKHNIRIRLTNTGEETFEIMKEIFPDEINFLEIFGKRVAEERAIKIISESIPKSYWKGDDKF